MVQVAVFEDFDPYDDGKQGDPSDEQGPPQGVELVLGDAREHAPEGDQDEGEAEGVHQGKGDARLVSQGVGEEKEEEEGHGVPEEVRQEVWQGVKLAEGG